MSDHAPAIDPRALLRTRQYRVMLVFAAALGLFVSAVSWGYLELVLGPEAPLIAIGMGLGMLSIQLIRRGAPDQMLSLFAVTGAFAAISSLFGSPVVGAIIMIEAAGLGGATLPVILVPGLLAA